MLVGLLGHHIAYSASPGMQNAAFKAAGLDDWSYELFDVPPEELAAAVAGLRLPGRAGANVTIPHKLAVIPLLDACDELSTQVGAVNFIRRDGDRLIAATTTPEPTAGLVFYDLKSALRGLGEPEKPKRAPARRATSRKKKDEGS